jgi:predicted RNase H-like nuclease
VTGSNLPLRLFGIDGCRGGWVVAESRGPAETPAFRVERTFAGLLTTLQGERALIAVDIPIGLPSGPPADDGRRRCDGEARALLGQRAVSVFSAPCRQTLAATSYADACRLEVGARQRGSGISRQAYGIVPKIREVDEVISPAHQQPIGSGAGIWIREAHPEVCFAVLSAVRLGGDGSARGLAHAKRVCRACRILGDSCPGESDRLDLLRGWFGPFNPAAVRRQLAADSAGALRVSDVARDDIVDAVACLATAHRIADGQAWTLPAGAPQIDRHGLRMEIVA